jgi:hypothetical protein
MRSYVIEVLALCMVSAAVLAYDNNVPIPSRRVGWSQGCSQKSGIEIEVVYDLLCSGSAAMDSVFQQFLDTPFLNGTVRQNVNVNYVFFPLPYHHSTWVVSKLVPLIVDNTRRNKTNYNFLSYVQQCWKSQDFILGATNQSQSQIIDVWTTQVAQNLKLNKTELLTAYDNAADTHNSEQRTRQMWKYASAKGVSGTPFAYVNGIRLGDFPETVGDW